MTSGLLILLLLMLARCAHAVWRRGEPPYGRTHETFDFVMPKVQPKQADDYYCTAKHVTYDECFIVNFDPKPEKANHMLLFGCANISNEEHIYPGFWNCDRNEPCKDLTILYGWAQNTTSITLPKDVGFRIGQQSPIKYLVLQTHYAKGLEGDESDSSGLRLQISKLPQRFLAGIHVLYASNHVIPPGHYNYHIDINCRMLLQESMFLFAYRVHTHSLGTTVSGYKYNMDNSSWSLLAKGNPHWPQAFYPMSRTVRVQPGDILAARCTYNTMGKKTPTSIGRDASMEMCNLYFMYYALSSSRRSSGKCENVELSRLAQRMPSDDDRPDDSSYGPVFKEGTPYHETNVVDNHFNIPGAVDHRHHLPPTSRFSYKTNTGWPTPKVNLGQVVAVSLDRDGNVVIFHRGSHIWSAWSFNDDDVYVRVEEGPIPEATVVTFDAANGHLLYQWGDKMFYLPHGLTIDSRGFIWVTDVALHQVQKYPPSGGRHPLLTLGKAFTPGHGENLFCKPTSVAVTLAGDFFVADGYCNARVAHFDKNGKFLQEIGEQSPNVPGQPPPSTFSIPHKVVLAEREGLLCVADRENGRIQCFAIKDGTFAFQIAIPEFQHQLYSIAYSEAEAGGLLLAVSGPVVLSNSSKGFIFNLTSHDLLGTLAPPNGTFTTPHDIACSKDVEEVYVGEINPDKIWRFVKDVHRSTKKILITTSEAEQPHVTHHGSNNHLGNTSAGVFPVNPSGTDEDGENFGVSMVIMALLAIPVLSFIVITIIVRLRKRGKLKVQHSGGKHWLSGSVNGQSKFDLGKLLNPHRGFDRVALEESDGGISSDSDVEEFNAATRKA
ncbi:peptidylglycine alpha-amidating monooxygenase-like [Ornithodoros turicata]|uniref:peptidylglycine alpha-amidating monooxygenase-like n=1 Tax=Ornithodoros turicata TaxID=34597 RepID=UPI003138F50B